MTGNEIEAGKQTEKKAAEDDEQEEEEEEEEEKKKKEDEQELPPKTFGSNMLFVKRTTSKKAAKKIGGGLDIFSEIDPRTDRFKDYVSIYSRSILQGGSGIGLVGQKGIGKIVEKAKRELDFSAAITTRKLHEALEQVVKEMFSDQEILDCVVKALVDKLKKSVDEK